MSDAGPTLLHATAVALQGVDSSQPDMFWAVLLRGAPGAGKSDLALRLIEGGGRLVSDDQVSLSLAQGLVYASAPETIKDMIEVRGVGLVREPALARAPVALILDLVPREEVARLPDAEMADLLGLALPVLKLYPFEASAPMKVKVALRSLLG